MSNALSMLAAAELKSRVISEVPADIDTALASGDWRARAMWPVSQVEANLIATGQVRRALALIDALDDRLARDAALLALPNILGYGRAIVAAALAVQRLNGDGKRFASAIPEFAFLQSGEGRVPARGGPILPAEPIRFGFARRAARCYSWTGAARLPGAIVAPSAVAVSHNALLRSEASGEDRAVGYRHAESFLGMVGARGGEGRTVVELAPQLARAVLGDALGESAYAERAGVLLAGMVRPHLERSGPDMAALRGARLPREIWSGSGGLYAPRAVGLEVLRRGGRVVRFDHGTPRGFVESAEVSALLEFSVSSEFVLATPAAATICREHSDETLAFEDGSVTVRGGGGDPTFAGIAVRRGARAGRKRVVYAPTQLLGFRQVMPPQQPDVIYLDWQMRLVEALRGLPVDLVCQPHPEGLLRGRPHPLEALATTRRGNFEAQLQSADLCIFDFPTTTALWQAACTDVPILYLDIEAARMTPPVARLFTDRARVIHCAADAANRPVVDAGALRDAVLGDCAPADPAPFRRLLAGAR